jgi:hypothetical protein
LRSSLYDYMERDHDRLDRLLASSVRSDGSVDGEIYEEFRRGLLRHIAIEEKVIFPEVRRLRGESEIERQLHRDHAVLAALLVPPPTGEEIGAIRRLLSPHNDLEEREGGLYDVIEALAGEELAALMERVAAVPQVPTAPHADTPVVRRSIEQLMREAEEGRRKLEGS